MNSVLTIVTRNYLHFALNLLDSISQTESVDQLCLFVADEITFDLPEIGAAVEVIPCSELEIPNWERMSFQYTPFELVCALKPYAMKYVLDHHAEKAVYLDADIHVYQSLSPIFNTLNQTPLLLTPHWVSNADASSDCDELKTILRSGIFNAGFLAVRKSDTASHFLDWWSSVCRNDCYVDVEDGVFVDQAWLDLVPSMFPDAQIERGTEYNVGHWNVGERNLQQGPDGWTVGHDSQPLSFFHFSGVDLGNPSQLSKHQWNKQRMDAAWQELVREYSRCVDRFEPGRFESLGCGFSRWADGVAIDPRWREAIRSDCERLRDVDNPWDLERFPELRTQLIWEEPHCAEQRVGWEQYRRREQRLLSRLKRRWRSRGR